MPVHNFKQSWTREFPWVKEAKEKQTATCTWCNTSFSFATMGRSSLVSHSKGKKHLSAQHAHSSSYSLQYLLPPPSKPMDSSSSSAVTHSTTTSNEQTSTQPEIISLPSTSKDMSHSNIFSVSKSPSSLPHSTLDRFKINDQVTEAEIIWCLQTVLNHNSLRNAESAVNLFPSMFPDSDIAKQMKLHKDKIAYSIVYGLGYFFQQQLKMKLKDCTHLVVSFDESFNRIAQQTQMDISVRHWDEGKNQVNTRYLTSEFLNHAKADDLFNSLKIGLEGLQSNKIIQLSMDGPNVNWAVLNLLKEEMASTPDSKRVLELGSCGLHTVHGAFKTGIVATDWNLVQFFRAAFNLFKMVPARRGDYIEITKSSLFPLKFCNIRWIENSNVAKRCLEVLPNLETYVSTVKGTKKEPESSSFKVVASAIKDKLLPAKIAFFQGLAEEFEPFLTEFQSDAPLVPFLHGALLQLIKNLMSPIVKKEVLDKENVTKIDVMKKEDGIFVNLVRVKELNLGYATRNALKKCSGVSQKEMLDFKKDVRKCLQTIICKLLAKSPLKYPLTKALTFLNPTSVAASFSVSCENLRNTLDTLIDCNLIPCYEAERVEREYKDLISQSNVKKEMENYRRGEKRVDDFWMQSLINNPSPQPTDHLKKVIKMCLILSHGNSFVERGFSVNKEILIENLKQKSLIAQRVIHDAVSDAGGIKNILPISKTTILAMRNAHSRFREAEEERKKTLSVEEKKAAEKRKAKFKAKELEEKKIKLMKDVSEEVTLIEEEIKQLRNQ